MTSVLGNDNKELNQWRREKKFLCINTKQEIFHNCYTAVIVIIVCNVRKCVRTIVLDAKNEAALMEIFH